MSEKPKRRWFQFSLRAMLVCVTLGAVGLGWYMYRWRQQQAEQRKAAAAVRELGGEAQPSLSSYSLASVIFEQGDAENLFFLQEKNIRDDDLKIFAAAENTRGLYLFKNEITDGGLVHLKNLRRLRILDLRHNKEVSDEGLKQLENLEELEQLILMGTKVTPAGVARLQQKLPRTKIAF
jgi:hypothetical protein